MSTAQDTTQGAGQGAENPGASLATGSTPTAPAAAQLAADPAADFKARVADLEVKLAEHAARVAELATERDALSERAKAADTLTGERDRLAGEVKKLTDQSRETALLDKLFGALPHAPRGDVKRMLRGLADEGKANRYSDNADKTAAEILDILKADGSALLRAPVGAGGGTNPTLTVSPQVDPLLAAFGPRRRK
jgi:hypothetical protein